LNGFYRFAPPNVVLSNQFNEELMRFACFYDNKDSMI